MMRQVDPLQLLMNEQQHRHFLRIRRKDFCKLQILPFTAYLGGGGAGSNVGSGDPDGSLTAGGDSNVVGDGGGLGQGGTSGVAGPITHYPGGSAGRAIVGVSNVTFTNAGTILGAQVG